jgi:hypothetical protein
LLNLNIGEIEMIHFKNDSFIIEVKTGINPVEGWIDTYTGIMEILQFTDKNQISEDSYYRILSLVQQMIPETEVAMKMQNNGLP